MATENDEYVCELWSTDLQCMHMWRKYRKFLNIGKNKFDIHAELFTS